MKPPHHPGLHYDDRQGTLLASLHFRNTVLPGVLVEPGFWIFGGIHLIVFGFYSQGYLHEDHWAMDKRTVRILTGLTIFVEVFYTNQCYKRYTLFWALNRKMCAKVYDFIFRLRLLTRLSGKPYDAISARWLLLSHLLALSKDEGRSEGTELWANLQRMSLVSPGEVAFLARLDNEQRTLVLTQAAADLARAGLVEVGAPMSMLGGLLQPLLEVRDLHQEVGDLISFPMPYQYFHLINFMVTIDLTLWAWSMGCHHSLFSPMFFFISAFIFLGMMHIASQLADPFGTDDVDFPLQRWAAELAQNLAALLEYEHDLMTELEEESKRMTLSLELTEVENILHARPDEAGGGEFRRSGSSKLRGTGSQEGLGLPRWAMNLGRSC